MFKAGAYLRLSKEDGDREISDSIENQRTQIENYVKQQEDMILVDFYIDDGYSGLNFQRPSFIRMMAEVHKGNINTIITKDMSRLGREHIETSNYIEKIFPLKSIRYIALLDNYDSFTGSNVEIGPFKSLLNDMYAKDISKKVKSAFQSKMSRGEFIGAFAPYGYKKDPLNHNHLIVDEYAAAVVQRIFDLYKKGLSKTHIAKILNRECIPCPSAYKTQEGQHYKNSKRLDATSYWTYSTIHKTLQNEVYVGHMLQRKSEMISYKIDKKRCIDRANWIIVTDTHAPIIDNATFCDVQALLATRKRCTNYEGHVTIYASILKCGDCGRAMSKTTSKIGKGLKANYFKCGTYKTYGKEVCTSHTIREDALSAIVLEAIKAEARRALVNEDIQELSALSKKMQTNSNKREDDKLLQLKIEKTCNYLTQAYEDYVDKILSIEDYMMLKDRYTKEKKQFEIRRSDLDVLHATQCESRLYHNEWVSKFIHYIDIGEITRELMVELIESILIFENKRIEITFRFEKDTPP